MCMNMETKVLDNVIWVVEKESKLTEYLRQNKYEVQNDPNKVAKEACAIAYGSINFVKYVRTDTEFIPGHYYDPGYYNCNYYYPLLHENLLNSDYILLPLSDIPRIIRKLQVEEDKLFVRPVSGNKVFAGQVIDVRVIEKEIKLIDWLPFELTLISSHKQLTAEYRFLVVRGEVITGSKYLPEESTEIPEKVLEYAKKVAPDDGIFNDVCCMDVAELESGEMKIVEFNAFSTSGLYKMDLEKVVTSVSKEALNKWKEMWCV